LRTCTQPSLQVPPPHTDPPSYFVTELLGTDLHRLLTSRPLEKQFIQYFLYQILVRSDFLGIDRLANIPSAVSNTSTPPVLFTVT
jgi:hypothetical protein